MKEEVAKKQDSPSLHGLECPRCGCKHHVVLYTRAKGNTIMRRKECRHCGKRMFTQETYLPENSEI